MNLAKLFETQKILRERIIKQHQLDENELLPNLMCALAVEIGELANETRCFKHWSIKPPSPKDVIIEELVDVLHFLLEIGLSNFEEYGEQYQILIFLNHNQETIKYDSLTEQFNSMFTEVGILSDRLFENCYTVNTVEDSYNNLVGLFNGLGEMLGFTWEQIEQAYYDKNRVNHERQDNGY